MARTETTQIPLGFSAPDFSLLEPLSGEEKSLTSLKGERATVIMFICNHCPYVIHIRAHLVAIARAYQDLGVRFIAISSNDAVEYPEDAPDKMAELASDMEFPFPYLYDEDQQVARSYFAACTPDISIFDASMHCVYRGRLDGSTPGNGVPVTGEDLKTALDSLLAGKPMTQEQLPSIGCNIKWKKE